MVVFLALMASYIIVGSVYNMQTKKVAGVDALPHPEFWKAGYNLVGHRCDGGTAEVDFSDAFEAWADSSGSVLLRNVDLSVHSLELGDVETNLRYSLTIETDPALVAILGSPAEQEAHALTGELQSSLLEAIYTEQPVRFFVDINTATDCEGSWSLCERPLNPAIDSSCPPRRYTVTMARANGGTPCYDEPSPGGGGPARPELVDGATAACQPGEGLCPLNRDCARQYHCKIGRAHV